MRKHVALKGMLLAAALLLTACQGKQREEARLSGIQQLKNQDYAGAIASFEQALELSGGRVSAFELDVLKYRAEAEYLLADYAAAAHTYEVLLQVDEERFEYRLYRSLALAQSGRLSEAADEYRAAETLAVTGGKETEKAAAADLLLCLGPLLEADPGMREIAGILYQEAIDMGRAPAALYNRRGLVMLAAAEGEDAAELDQAVSLFQAGLDSGEPAARRELLFNLAVAYERKLEFGRALQLFEQYAAEFGSDEAVEKEIAFLKTR